MPLITRKTCQPTPLHGNSLPASGLILLREIFAAGRAIRPCKTPAGSRRTAAFCTERAVGLVEFSCVECPRQTL